jgi:PAS domain S-box-containing protein
LVEVGAQQDQLLAILDETLDLVAIADLDAAIVYLNPAWRRRMGLPLDGDLSPIPLGEMLPSAAARAVLTDAIPLAIERGAWRGESAVLDRDSREIPVSLVLVAHRDTEGNVIRFSLSARDISAEKAERERMAHREEALRLVAEAAASTIWTWNLRDDTIDWSPALCHLMGVDPGQFPVPLGTIWNWIHPDDEALCARALREHLEHDAPLEVELRMRRGDGSYAVLITRGKSSRDATGHPLWIAGAVEDVTSRRRNEEILIRNERKYRRLVERTHTGFAVLDEQGRVIDANVHLAEMTGRRGVADVIWRNLLDGFTPRAERDAGFAGDWILHGRFPERLEVNCHRRNDGIATHLVLYGASVREGTRHRLHLLCHELGRVGAAKMAC